MSEKYISLRKSTRGIRFYIINKEKIAVQFDKNLFIKMKFTAEWYEYIRKTSIQIKPFEIRRFLKDLKKIRIKYNNWRNLTEPRKELHT